VPRGLTEVGPDERSQVARKRVSPRDYSPLVQAILAGEHDGDLEMIQSAAAHRVKTMFRRGVTVRVTRECSNPELVGRTGVVTKANQKTVSVGIGAPTTDQFGTAYEVGEYNFPPRMIEVYTGEGA
jgi:hypothetical protein